MRVRGHVVFAIATIATPAFATNVTEFPDNGSEQMARGGAWIARASDPLAVFYNPAGLAGQATRLTLQGNLVFAQTCFARKAAPNDTTNDPLRQPDGTFPTVCSDGAPHFPPNLQLAFTFSPLPKLGLGFAFLAPSGVAKASWPSYVDGNGVTGAAAPQRYLLLGADALFVTPTVGVGYELLDGLRLGASFQWGIASAKFASSVISLNTDNVSPSDNDLKAELSVSDPFVPGGTVGALWSPSDWVDIAGWFKFSKPIEASGDLKLYKGYFTPRIRDGRATYPNSGDKKADGTYQDVPDAELTDTAQPTCRTGLTGNPGAALCKPGLAKLTLPIPVELKIGVRVHQPRERAPHVRDPLRTDKWDAEIDLTWAHNSDISDIRVRFPPYDESLDGSGVLPVNGLMGSPIPANADQPHRYRDVLGVRLGGDVNVVPDKLALRGGAFMETQATNTQYQTIDFMGGGRVGLALGATYRLHVWSKSAIDLSAGFMHMFVFDTTNDGPNGISALAGTACNPSSNTGPSNTPFCTDGRQKFRTNWAVNLGTISSQLTAINFGASYRF